MIHDIETKNWVIGNNSEILDQIHLPTTNIGIYNRDISHLTSDIKNLMLGSKTLQISGKIELITQHLKKELNEYPLIVDDVISQLHLFAKLTHAKEFRLTLATVTTNMCRKFHTDINDLRMLCTYSGPGTLWLKDKNVNQSALNSVGNVEQIVIDANKIEQVQEGSVILLKGALYPSDNTNAIVHRSPSIEEAGEQRLLLRIDTNEFLNFDI